MGASLPEEQQRQSMGCIRVGPRVTMSSTRHCCSAARSLQAGPRSPHPEQSQSDSQAPYAGPRCPHSTYLSPPTPGKNRFLSLIQKSTSNVDECARHCTSLCYDRLLLCMLGVGHAAVAHGICDLTHPMSALHEGNRQQHIHIVLPRSLHWYTSLLSISIFKDACPWVQ